MIVLLADENRGLRNTLMSSIGWAECCSQRTNPMRAMAAITNEATTMSLDQPFSGPSMMPNSSVASPTIDRIAPNGSSRVCLGSRDFGMTKAPRMSAVAPIGMFTQNTELHEKCSSNRPPVIGPTATASPETPAQMAIARPRSRGSRKTLVRIDNVAGMISAPPTPMKARVKISCVAEFERAAAADPIPNSTMPACSAPLRPKRSDRLPLVSSRPANTIT